MQAVYCCLISSVLIILKYVRAERGGDWRIHLRCVEAMIPYFFDGGHVHYARHALYYLRSSLVLHADVWRHFEKENMPSTTTLESGTEFCQTIETTYMRYGITGVTLNDECVKIWVYGIPICSNILQNLDEMRNVDPATSQLHHKGEFKDRITSDGKDRLSLREKLELYIDPLDPEQHPRDGLVNIVTGEVVYHRSVNVDQ